MIEVVSPSVALGRRVFFAAANLVTYGAMLGGLAHAIGGAGGALAIGGSGLALVLVVAFAVFAPWSVLGFWNAAIGLTLLFSARRGVRANTAARLRTAIVMTVRNEDPERAVARLRVVQRSIDATGEGDRFGFFLLSDTSDPEIAANEEAAMVAWRAEAAGAERLHYRRRDRNAGFKAGNVMEFCRLWADE